MNEKLITIPSPMEIKEAMFAIHLDKAPGPDGFSASFFQSNWDAIGPAIIKEIQCFFISGSLPSSINETHIRLIPKILSPKQVSDYHPIALCNVYYKTISKILSLRLKPVLQEIISENQSAFIPERVISDNVLITHEMLHFLKISGATKHCSMAVKTDVSKAYDRLEWSFLETVLQRLGFHDTLIYWMMQCVTSVSYSFLINNEVSGSIIPQRGIRQGDPLSPYIFILCAEVLSGLCNKAQINGSMPGIRASRNSPRINHLLFADDTMLFTRTDVQSCTTLMEILHSYEAASGQMINAAKSSISFSAKTSQEVRDRVKLQLGIEKEGGVGKYLGLPEHFGRRKKDLFSSIVDRIKQRAISWSTRFLSTARKATMLQAVLAAIPTFAMTCFELPLSLCKRIQSALTRFWWDATDGERKICWVSWDTLTLPKALGGLGFRDIQTFNQALLGKIAWRIIQKPDCLLARVLLGKYCHKTSFLKVGVPSGGSHGWKGILLGSDLLLQHLGKAIGDGESTSLWRDSWIDPHANIIPQGPILLQDQDLLVSDILARETKEWNIARIDNLMPELTSHILTLRPSLSGAADTFIWTLQDSGAYTAKSGYQALQMDKIQAIQRAAPPEPEDWSWTKDIWTPPLLPKLKFFLWKAARGALPIGESLRRRGMTQNINCCRCGEPETILHLFSH